MPTLLAPDGVSLYYESYEPRVAVPGRPAVLFITGWSDHAGRWQEAGTRLSERGYRVHVLDQRGHGRSHGARGHLSRFSQLLGDLQAFRRAVRARAPAPHVLVGHSFGGLVVLRYLESQPSDPILAAAVSSPFLGLAQDPPLWRRLGARMLGDLWPTLSVRARIDPQHVSRDHVLNDAYAADPLVHDRMTIGAWHEIHWAQRAVVADGGRVECPLQFLLAGEDRIVDAHLARAFAGGLKVPTEVRWYPEMYHEVLHDPGREAAFTDLLAFLDRSGTEPGSRT
ncbi:MAG TPA: alpha/beta hydrolase [Gemmatimonadales bacterium]|nr:alpha/beta hydrolase [Gemmatimonadales bacterium]